MTIAFSFFASHRTSVPEVFEETWEDIRDDMLKPEPAGCTKDDCQAKDCDEKLTWCWSPAIFRGSRKKRNVATVNMAVFDIDHVTLDNIRRIIKRLKGVSCFIHSTHSNLPPDDMAFRLVIQLSRPVSPEEWLHLFEVINSKYKCDADTACKDPSRLYFAPTYPMGSEWEHVKLKGKPLNVDRLLGEQVQPPSEEDLGPQEEPEAPEIIEAEEGNLADVREHCKERLKKLEGESADIMRAVLKGESLSGQGHRDLTLTRATKIVSWAVPTETPTALIVELFRRSVVAMDCSPEGPAHWLALAEAKYETAREGTAIDRAEFEEEARETEELRQALSAEFLGQEDEEGEEDDEWKDSLIIGQNKRPAATAGNLSIIFSKASEFRGKLRWDEVNDQLHFSGGPFAEVHPEAMIINVRIWLEFNLGVTAGPEVVMSTLHGVARRDPYDPLREHLESLEWDGVERGTKLFTHYLEAAENPDYCEAVAKRWLVSLVARGMEPGCKVDTVLIIEGVQGLKKSQALNILGGDFYCESSFEAQDKDKKLIGSKYWLIEMAELAGLGKKDAEHLKNFISTRVDSYRPPYGKVMRDAPRRCVFVGSTNDDVYLKDHTGNRRYWPLALRTIHLEDLKRDRDQIIAEAVHWYKKGELWWAQPEELGHFDDAAEKRNEAPPYVEQILSHFIDLPLEQRPKSVSADKLITKVLEEKHPHRYRKMVGVALRLLGFKKGRGADRTRVWDAPEYILTTPRGTPLYIALSQRPPNVR